ncbi:MFS transporter [Chloroflexota bacterium]
MQSEIQEPVSLQPVSTFDVLRQPNFRWLFMSAILANSATWIQSVTMGWLVYDITSSGTMLGTVNLMSTLASLVLAPFAGIAIDRRSRRRLMLGANTWFLIINAVMGLALLAGITQVWPLLVFSLLIGLGMAIDYPLRQTVLFDLVPRRLTPSALGFLQTGWAVMRTLGPAIGGILLVWVGAGGSFLLQTGIFALVILSVLQLSFPAQQTAGSGKLSSGSFVEGARHIVKNAHTRAFTFMGCILKLFIIPIFVVMPPIFAKDIFQGGPQILGYLLSAVGLGGVLGGLVATSMKKVDHRGRLELVAMILLGLSLAAFGASPEMWMALIFLGLAGFFEMIFLINNQTHLQLSIRDELRGRVNGIIALGSGLIPLGSLLAGFGADTIGPRQTTVIMGGAAALITLIVFWASSTIRDYRLSEVLA